MKRRVGEKLLPPLLAAGTSVAASYIVKKGPAFVEGTVLPWLRETAQGAGGAAEKLPEKARSAVSSGGELAEQLTDKAREAVGGGDDRSSGRSGRLSADELSRRSEERAQHRAQRRRRSRR
ncbi:MAG: hypothetical protein ACJ75G_05730 [Gaiellaceae bacterium]